MILFMYNSWNDKIIKIENRLVVARVQGEGGDVWEVAMVIKGQRVGSLYWWKCSASWPYHYQCSSYDITLY